MSARIPHLLTRLLSSDDLDALTKRYVDLSLAALGTPAEQLWMEAARMLSTAREASYQRRAKLTPSARRKSLSRYTRQS